MKFKSFVSWGVVIGAAGLLLANLGVQPGIWIFVFGMLLMLVSWVVNDE